MTLLASFSLLEFVPEPDRVGEKQSTGMKGGVLGSPRVYLSYLRLLGQLIFFPSLQSQV